jgi:hypothetical protein
MSLFKDKNEPFEQTISKAIADEIIPPSVWFFVPFIKTETGKFQTAVIAGGKSWIEAATAALHVRVKDDEEIGRNHFQIPADRVPAEQYRNRILTREEIETIWPESKGK